MATYRIVGTKKPYTGRVIEIGGILFTTQGGGIEGDRQQVELAPATNIGNAQTQQEVKDIVTPFIVGVSPGSPFFHPTFSRNTYFYDNGDRVPNGTRLHHHTIPAQGDNNFMTQHDMNGAVNVFINRQSTTRGTDTRQTQQINTPNQTSNNIGGTPSGGARNTGGMGRTGGGGSSY